MQSNFCHIYSLVRAAGKEFARCALYWTIAFTIIVPSSFQALAAEQGAAKSEAEQYERLELLTKDIQDLIAKSPEDPAIKSKQEQANSIANEIMSEVQLRVLPITNSIAPLREKILSGNANSEEKQQYAELVDRLTPLKYHQRHLMSLAGSAGIDVPFEMNLDSSTKDFISGGISIDSASKDENVEMAPPGVNKRRSITEALAGTGMHFSTQYFTFSVSMGLMAVAQLQFMDLSDPNAFENWEKQTFSLLGAESFAAFMAANHVTVKMLQRVRGGTLPPSLLNYIGMAAGSVMSSTFSEFWTDKNVWACMKPYYNSKIKVTPGACEKTYTTWMVHNKIMQYAPSIISMIGSTHMSQAIRSKIAGLKKMQSFDKNYVKVVVRGVRVISKARLATRAAVVVAKGAVGFTTATADFVLFLALDAYVTSTPINEGFQRLRSTYDPVAWANEHGLHSEFFWPKEGEFQPIANAFDVTATTPYTAHQFLMSFYRQMQENGWKKPAPVESCIPTSIKASKQLVGKEDISNKWFFQKWSIQDKRKKSADQLACEVYSRPVDLLDRYSEKSREWRETILSRFRTSQNNWINMINQFSTMYEASYLLGNHLATEKFNVLSKGAPKPDLSRETLAKVIKAPLPKADSSEAEEETAKLNSWFLDGTSLPTPELIDYITAGFACGPDPVLKTGVGGRTIIQRAYDNVSSMIGQNVVSPTYMTTPYGSSLHFTPPKLTSKSRAICENSKRSLYATINYVTGSYLPEGSKDGINANPFVGPFKDDDGKEYATLADFAFENLSTDVYKPIGKYTGFSTWWTEHFTEVITPVWNNYQKKYDEFISKYYVPVLFNRTYSGGCRGEDDVTPKSKTSKDADGILAVTGKTSADTSEALCTSDSNAYRVSEGVFLGIETEMRNYMRGLFSLYMSTIDKADDVKARKAAFVESVNQIITDIRMISPEAIREKDFGDKLDTAQKNVEMLIDLVAVRLNALPTSTDNEFRKQMLEKFKDQMSKVIEDERHHAEAFQAFDFQGGASNRVPDKNLNSTHSANPLHRQGG